MAIGRGLLSGARRVGWWYLVAVLAMLHLYGATLIALAALKPFFPDNVGLWLGPGKWGLGAHFCPEAQALFADAPERLGWWAIPVFLGLGVFALWVGNGAFRNLARRRLAHLRAGLCA